MGGVRGRHHREPPVTGDHGASPLLVDDELDRGVDRPGDAEDVLAVDREEPEQRRAEPSDGDDPGAPRGVGVAGSGLPANRRRLP
jgi:hypothetical protein